MPAQAEQTITFLFVDIADIEDRADTTSPASGVHSRAIIDASVALYHGAFIATNSDVIGAAFASANLALAAAIRIQRACYVDDEGPRRQVSVRMALHTGLVEVYEEEYIGFSMSRVACLLKAAHPGQFLISRATHDLVKDYLPLDVEIYDLGVHRLSDLTLPEHIFQVVVYGMPLDFPPIITLNERPTNIPSQSTPLIGRDPEMMALGALLRRMDVRLVTLTGPGGVGKTRLGLHAAASLFDMFTDGVFFVNLAAINDPASVIAAIAQALSLEETAQESLIERINSYVYRKRLLLVLDNFEHIIAAAQEIAALLSATTTLKIIITSREALRISGEYEFAVAPLALPDPAGPLRPAYVVRSAAVRLFVERARAVRSNFALTSDNALAIVELCRRFDGLPLAIELLACNKLLEPQALLARLNRRLFLMTRSARDLPARQQTLRKTLDWSYELLTMEEQVLFARLAVFVGGGTLEAVETICGDIGGEQRISSSDQLQEVSLNRAADQTSAAPLSFEMTLSHAAFLDTFSSLVNKSLVQSRESRTSMTRFMMLETIHEYACEQLQASGTMQTLQCRHAAYYLELAERAEPELGGAQQHMWLTLLDGEYDNLRAALQRLIEEGEFDRAARFSNALWRFWWMRGHLSEGRRWLDLILAHSAALSTDARANLLLSAGVLAQIQGEFEQANTLLAKSLELWRDQEHHAGIAKTLRYLGGVAFRRNDHTYAQRLFEMTLTLYRDSEDPWDMACVFNNLGVVAFACSNYPQARRYLQESLELRRELGDAFGLAAALNNLGNVSAHQGQYQTAQTLYEEGLALRRNLGDKAGIASSLLNLSELARDQGNFIYAGELLAESITLHTALEDRNALLFCLNSQAHLIYYQGDDSRAAEMFQETLVLAQKYDDTFHTASACYFLGMLSLRQNDTARAQTLLAQALELYRKVGNQREIARVLEGHAAFAVAQGMMAEAAQFYGAAAALRESIDAPLPPVDQGSYAQLVASIRARCGAEACAIHWTKGRTMTMDQISAIYQTCLTPTNIHNAPDSKPLSQTTYPAGLTPREAEVLRLLSTGLTNRQIAEQLVLSHLTVGAHLRSIYSKVGVTTRAAATRFAVEQRIT